MVRRTAGVMILLAGLTGCVTTNPNKSTGGKFTEAGAARTAAGIQGPWGQPVPVNGAGQAVMPYGPSGVTPGAARVAGGEASVQQVGHTVKKGYASTGADGSIVNPTPAMYEAQMASGDQVVQASHPAYYTGGAYGPAGPGGPPIAPPVPPPGVPGAVAGVGLLPPNLPAGPLNARTSVLFSEPAGMRVAWMSAGNVEQALTVPGRYNFLQGGLYRLKLSKVRALPNKDLYPTIEVVPANLKTAEFLAHSSVPVAFTEEDFEQVAAGNYLVKVIYLPDPQFQDLAIGGTGLGEIVSSRLEPNLNPVEEARKRGSILAIIRLGNIDLQAPNSPSMDAPNPYLGMPGGVIMTPPAPIGGIVPVAPAMPAAPIGSPGDFLGGKPAVPAKTAGGSGAAPGLVLPPPPPLPVSPLPPIK